MIQRFKPKAHRICDLGVPPLDKFQTQIQHDLPQDQRSGCSHPTRPHPCLLNPSARIPPTSRTHALVDFDEMGCCPFALPQRTFVSYSPLVSAVSRATFCDKISTVGEQTAITAGTSLRNQLVQHFAILLDFSSAHPRGLGYLGSNSHAIVVFKFARLASKTP